ncbi:MAG: very short patch repair endonuclease [Nanoarchaeota archaeon]|nr:very short patch repair endonuclease [Nanoarchaeota archaeon]
MVDVHTKKQRSYNMFMIKGKNTKPEVDLRKLLFSKGIRGYRIHSKLPGKPDIVFTKFKLAIFIDGCFWHKCPKCFIEPDKNKEFWRSKINGNVERDKKVNKILGKERWKVLRFWEHLLRKDINKVYRRISEELKKRGL